MTTTAAPPPPSASDLARIQEASDRHHANATYQAMTGDFSGRPANTTLRTAWTAKEVEQFFREAGAGRSEDKGGLPEGEIERVLGE